MEKTIRVCGAGVVDKRFFACINKVVFKAFNNQHLILQCAANSNIKAHTIYSDISPQYKISLSELRLDFRIAFELDLLKVGLAVLAK